MPLREDIMDSKFRGMAVRVSLINGEDFEGIVDDVARYELGLTIRDSFYIVFRHSIAFIEVNAVDLHGEKRAELDDSLITADFIGVDADILLINNRKLSGRLIKISKYELGIRADDKGLIIPKSSIIYIKIRKS